jgi:hypothetical protein
MNLRNSFILVTLVSLFVLLGSVQAANLTEAQRAHIDRYLASNNLNQYGDVKGTMYLGGNPLFSEVTGSTIDRYDLVLVKLPHILDSFVSTLPFDGAQSAVAATMAIDNDFSSRRLQDRAIDAALQAEEKSQALVNRIRAAIDEGDYKAVAAVLTQLEGLSAAELRQFGTVLRDARRMVNGVFIHELSVTRQLTEIQATLNKLQAKLAA